MSTAIRPATANASDPTPIAVQKDLLPRKNQSASNVALLAPTPRARRLMIVAVGLELVIGVCAFVHWFVPRSPI